MKRYFLLGIVVVSALTQIEAQSNQVNSNDTFPLSIRGSFTAYYIDGFRIFYKLTENDSTQILQRLVAELNGSWKADSENYYWKYKLSEKTFKGKISNSEKISATWLVRLELIKGQIKLITSTIQGDDRDTANIRIEKELVIDEHTYHRQTK